jgi:hypothetical protein
MTARSALVIVVATLTLLGCVSAPIDPRTKKPAECSSASCSVAVTVIPDWLACKVSVDPELLIIRGRGQASVIHFELKTPGYRFAADGIVVEDADPVEIRCLRQGEERFVCQNRHSISKAYKYVVKVTGPCHTPPLDPYFFND